MDIGGRGGGEGRGGGSGGGGGGRGGEREEGGRLMGAKRVIEVDVGEIVVDMLMGILGVGVGVDVDGGEEVGKGKEVAKVTGLV